MIGENLLRYKKDQKYIILDCETCHLNLVDKGNVPWQWAWVECTQSQILSKQNIYVKWDEINIDPKVAIMTGFYQRTIDTKGISPEEALQRLEKVIYDPQYKIVLHNGLNFDIYLHNIHRKLVGKDADYSYLDRVLDSNALARSLKYDIKIQKDENLLAFQYKFVNAVQRGMKTSIMALCKEYDIEYDSDNAHDAEWDVETLRKIWFKMIWQLEI